MSSSQFIILQDFGSDREWTGDPEWTRRHVVHCISKGEWIDDADDIKVVELVLGENSCRDITADIAREVYDLAFSEDYGRMSRDVRNFCERHGVVVMEAAE